MSDAILLHLEWTVNEMLMEKNSLNVGHATKRDMALRHQAIALSQPNSISDYPTSRGDLPGSNGYGKLLNVEFDSESTEAA